MPTTVMTSHPHLAAAQSRLTLKWVGYSIAITLLVVVLSVWCAKSNARSKQNSIINEWSGLVDRYMSQGEQFSLGSHDFQDYGSFMESFDALWRYNSNQLPSVVRLAHAQLLWAGIPMYGFANVVRIHDFQLPPDSDYFAWQLVKESTRRLNLTNASVKSLPLDHVWTEDPTMNNKASEWMASAVQGKVWMDLQVQQQVELLEARVQEAQRKKDEIEKAIKEDSAIASAKESYERYWSFRGMEESEKAEGAQNHQNFANRFGADGINHQNALLSAAKEDVRQAQEEQHIAARSGDSEMMNKAIQKEKGATQVAHDADIDHGGQGSWK